MAITVNNEQGRVVYYGLAADRTAIGSAPFGVLFVETDTLANAKCYIGTGNGTNWLGPYTAAQVGLGGGGSSSGIQQVSTLPLGSLLAEAEITATTTAATLVLAYPAKALELTLRNILDGSATVPTKGHIACWVTPDPPDAATRDVWLTTTNAGVPREVVLSNGVPVNLAFTNPDGTQATITSLGYKFSAIDANVILSPRIVT